MKKILAAIILSSAALVPSCLNDSFMERYPLDAPTAETAFVTYDNFKAYAWGLYETFRKPGYGDENATDDISYNSTRGTGESAWIRNTFTIPDSRNNTTWNYYSFIRRVNLMLDHVDSSSMADVEKEHWRSVGYFFRSYRYFSLLCDYGDVPWVDHVLSDNETELINGPRNTRDEIAGHILEDLQYAEKHIAPAGDGNNTINLAVVQALLSRFTLFEGTWRKYHGLAQTEVYLNECKRVSDALLASHPEVCANYDDLFCSLSLSGNPSVLLYREYANGAGVVHDTSIQGTTAAAYYQPTHDLVDSYLCSDGRPTSTSGLFAGDHDLYSEFACRDHRLWLHVTPPYTVDRSASADAWDNKWVYTDEPKDRAYIDSLAKMGLGLGTAKERQKTLPFRQGFSGGILGAVPHWSFYNAGQPWYASWFGYNSWKYFCTYLEQGAQRNEETDLPLFRIEEVMLNYAEAMCELGEFSQDVADRTVNKLRVRANVRRMTVGEIDSSFDLKRDLGNPDYKGDYEVNPLLWEVRRERRAELFCEGFRFNDLRRWKKCHYALKKKVGCYVRLSDFPAGTNVTIDGGGTEGYLEFHPAQTHLWPDYYYLYPLPRNEIVLNPQLKQNDGWQ